MTTASPERLSVTVERALPYPAEKIWRALTQPHLISEWLMKTDAELTPGRAFTLTGDWGGVECAVLESVPHETLSYSWNHPHADPAYALESTVTFTLIPQGSGTLVRMVQTGFRPDQKQAYGGAQYGWVEHLANLEKVLARLP